MLQYGVASNIVYMGLNPLLWIPCLCVYHITITLRKYTSQMKWRDRTIVAQLAERPYNCPRLVQLYWHEFESCPQHKVVEKKTSIVISDANIEIRGQFGNRSKNKHKEKNLLLDFSFSLTSRQSFEKISCIYTFLWKIFFCSLAHDNFLALIGFSCQINLNP